MGLTAMGLRLLALLALVTLPIAAQDCSTRNTYCETWVCTYVDSPVLHYINIPDTGKTSTA